MKRNTDCTTISVKESSTNLKHQDISDDGICRKTEKVSTNKLVTSKTDERDSSHEKNDHSDKIDKDSFSALKFEKTKTFDIKAENKPWISSIRALPNGNVIMADFNNSKLYVYQKSCEKQKAIPLSGNPCCIAVINSDRVAVSVQDQKSITLVDILPRKVAKCISVNDCSHGIAFNEEKLIVNCLEDGIKMMDLSGTVLHIIPDIVGEAYICVSENGNFYCSVYWSHKVLCFNKEGEQIYSFSNLTMKCPRGITVTTNGCVFTCEFGKNKVRCISPEGTKSQVVLNEKHEIKSPLCIVFDNNNLYISNNDGESVSIFKLEST